jgi:7-carboxy-7-deazaguanine synthase
LKISGTNVLNVNEVFYDIEGEGQFQGYPALFIRLTGCNLRCSWCDTKYAYFKGKSSSVNKLLGIVKKSPYGYINITGGEPLCGKAGVIRLIKSIKKARPDITVSVETNGSISIAGVPADNISMDIKLPSSGEQGRMMLSNLERLKPKDQLKLVIGSHRDMEYAREILSGRRVKCVIFAQPVFGKIKLGEIKKFIMKNRLNWKLSVQLHKIK